MSSDALAVVVASPLRIDRREVPIRDGSTVASVVAPIARRGFPLAVRLNGLPIVAPHECLSLVRAGDLLEVRALPGGGAKEIFRSLLVMAVLAGAGALGGSLAKSWGVRSLVGKALIKGALSAAGLLLLNNLIPPPGNELPTASGTDTPESSTYGIAGARNRAIPYGVIPCVLGYHRITPPHGAQPYTELVGPTQYLRMLLCMGYGPLDLSDIRVGDTLLSSYDDVETEEKTGAAADTAVTLFPDTVTETAVGVTITLAGGWVSRTTPADTDEISVDLEWASGLMTYVDGQRSNRNVVVAVEYRESLGPGAWISVTNKYVSGLTLVGGGSGYPAYTSQALSFSGGGGSGAAGTAQVNHAGVIVAVTLTAYGSGYTSAPSVSVAGGGSGETITATVSDGQVISAATGQPYRYGWRWAPAARGTYDVRISRGTADNAETTIVDAFLWQVLRSIQNEDPISLTRMSKLAVRIKATDQLNGVIDDLNLLAKSVCLDWDSVGEVWTSQATNNPASLFRYVLQGPMNAAPVADGRIDLTGLQTWHEACAVAGYEFNAVLDTPSTLWERLQQIAAAGRASPTLINGKYGVVRDVARSTAVQLFTPRNSRGFEGSFSLHIQPHAFRVRFINDENSYTQDEMIVYDDGYNAGTATIFEEISIFGITDPDLVWKHARYLLACQRLRRSLYQLETDVESLVCTRGDLVKVQHDVPLHGVATGRVKVANASTLVLDETVEMEAGTDYGILGRDSGGTITQWDVINGGSSNVLRLAAGEAAFDLEEGDLVAIGVRDSETKAMIVHRIEPGGELGARLQLVDYAAAVYTADSGSPPAFAPDAWYPEHLRPIVPPTDLAVVEYAYLEDGVLRNGATLSWRHGADNRLPDVYDVQVKRPGDAWVAAGQTTGEAMDIPWTPSGTYDFRVRAMAGIRTSEWVTLSSQALTRMAEAPDNVENLRMVYRSGRAAFVWDEVEDIRGVVYEIRLGGLWASGRVMSVQAERTYYPPQSGTYFIRAKSGDAYSATDASLEIEGTILEENVVETLTESPTFPGTLAGSLERSKHPDTWDLDYTADVEPDDGSLGADVWTRAGNDTASVAAGVLTINGNDANPPHYYRSASGQYPMRMEAIAKADAGCLAAGYGALMQLDNGDKLVSINIFDDRVWVNRSGGTDVVMLDVTADTTLELSLDGYPGTNYEVRADGVIIASGSNAATGSSIQYRFGTYGSCPGTDLDVYFDRVSYYHQPDDGIPQTLTMDGADGLTGSYTVRTADVVDLGYEAECAVLAEVSAYAYDSSYDLLLIDDLLDEADLLGSVTDYTVVPEIRVAGDDAVWGAWKPIESGSYYGRYFQPRLSVTLPSSTTRLTISSVTFTIDMPDRIAQDDQLLDAGGTAITFSPAFQATPKLVSTIYNATAGDDLQITGLTTTGFTAQVVNGGGQARTIHWIAKGY